DGYTLLFVSTSYTTTAATQTTLPFDPVNDLVPVAAVVKADLYMMTGNRVPMDDLEDLKNEAGEQTIVAGTPGLGSIGHLSQLSVNEALGIETEFVAHTSGANVMADLGGGRVDTYFGMVFEATSGTAKPVVVMSADRSEVLPD